jgi:cytochrome c oxidase cbb3-type subunit 3
MRGGIGPNLLDDQWIHGGSPAQILKTITDGVAAKGMPPWGQILGAAKVREVAAYVVRQNAKALGRPVPEQEEEEHHEREREH